MATEPSSRNIHSDLLYFKGEVVELDDTLSRGGYQVKDFMRCEG